MSDIISKEKVIDIFNELNQEIEFSCKEIISLVEKLPSDSKWVLAEDELPDEGELVFAIMKERPDFEYQLLQLYDDKVYTPCWLDTSGCFFSALEGVLKWAYACIPDC